MTNPKLIAEILAAHADRQSAGKTGSHKYAALFPQNDDLHPLLSLADQVKAALQPVQPPNAFKDQLQQELLAAAQLKQQQMVGGEKNGQTSVLLAVITGGLLAVSLLLILLKRRRQQHLLPLQ